MKNVEIINLTKKEIIVIKDNKELARFVPIKVELLKLKKREKIIQLKNIDIYSEVYNFYQLPVENKNIFYIVDVEFLLYNKNRTDLLFVSKDDILFENDKNVLYVKSLSYIYYA